MKPKAAYGLGFLFSLHIRCVLLVACSSSLLVHAILSLSLHSWAYVITDLLDRARDDRQPPIQRPPQMAEHVYPLRYAHTDGAWKPSTSPTTIDQARGTMIAIHRRQNPTIPMLQSVLSLSAHPEDLHLLNTTVIIDDCIQYLDWRRKQNLRYVSLVV